MNISFSESENKNEFHKDQIVKENCRQLGQSICKIAALTGSAVVSIKPLELYNSKIGINTMLEIGS